MSTFIKDWIEQLTPLQVRIYRAGRSYKLTAAQIKDAKKDGALEKVNGDKSPDGSAESDIDEAEVI